MRILIDIGHPAHVHYFRNLADDFMRRGSEVLFTTRDKEVTLKLLDFYGFTYVNFGTPFKTHSGKVWGLFWFTWKLFLVALKFKPDLYLNATMYSAIAAWLLRKPHISLEDTFNMEQVRLYLPFSSVVLTGDYPHPDLGKKEVRYPGYQELAYLHPRRFAADPRTIALMGMQAGEKYVILRFISWHASHDFGSDRISLRQKRELIEELEKHARVFISAESDLPDEMKKYRLDIPPQCIHDVLAFAQLYIGEGATMASECAMLGTPAIYINSQDAFTIQEQAEKYGLLFSYRDFNGVLDKARELLAMPGLKDAFSLKKEQMVAEKIDVTSFLIWFVGNFPDAKKIMDENPGYGVKFK